MARRLRRPGPTLRPAPGATLPSTSAPRPRRWRRTERRRPSTAGSGVACSSRSAAMRPLPARHPSAGFAIGIADACTSPDPLRGHRHLVGRTGLVGHRRPPLATGSTPGPPHRGPGHRLVCGALLADGLGGGGDLRAGERGVHGGDGAGGARRRLARRPPAPGAPRAARRHRRLHRRLADPGTGPAAPALSSR